MPFPFPLAAIAGVAAAAAAAAAVGVGVGRVAASWELIGHAGGGTVGKSADEVVGIGGWSGGNWTGPADMLDQGACVCVCVVSESGGKSRVIQGFAERWIERRRDEGSRELGVA